MTTETEEHVKELARLIKLCAGKHGYSTLEYRPSYHSPHSRNVGNIDPTTFNLYNQKIGRHTFLNPLQAIEFAKRMIDDDDLYKDYMINKAREDLKTARENLVDAEDQMKSVEEAQERQNNA